MNKNKIHQGFTLIELLIVIAVIAILAAAAFVALDPLSRFRAARDSARWTDITAVANALKLYQTDNNGAFPSAVTSMTAGDTYMIGTDVAGCDDAAANCDVTVSSDTSCVALGDLVTANYLGSVPISPNGAGTWDAAISGYTLKKTSGGIITVQACESEDASAISITR